MGKTVKHRSVHTGMKRSDATIGYGTIRTRGPFHRLFPCFHVAARVPPTRLAYTEKLAMRDGSLSVYVHPPSSLSRVGARAPHIYTPAYPRRSVDRGRFVAFLTPATRVCPWK